jgi:LmbE family N-acetylglucosaminyl deacetylase
VPDAEQTLADRGERCLCVVGHPDDELLFLSPDSAQSIRSGVPTTIVVVSAGEFNGNGMGLGEYADARRRGACAAYAAIAGVPDVWTRAAVPFAGRRVEVDVLDEMPTVRLVLLALPDGGNASQPNALSRMWGDPSVTARTLRYPDGPVRRSYVYRRSDLIGALVSIMDTSAPTVVRVHDANPDPLLRGEHDDHVAVARFTAAAMEAHVADRGAGPLLVQHRGYNTADCAGNLSPAVARAKREAFEVYLPFDSGAEGQPGWTERAYHRWELGTTWACADGDGRPHVFCVRGGAVWHWRRLEPAGAWAPPVDIGGGPIAPALTAESAVDGRVAVFGVSLDTHDIVMSQQASRNGPYLPWVSLGNPNGHDGPHTGAPVVGRNADGRLQVFAKNSGGGVSTTYQTATDGGFSPWVDFGGGPDVQEAPAVLLRADGRMMLFATTRTEVLAWTQSAPNAGWSPPSVLVSEPLTSAPSTALNADGRPESFHRTGAGAVRTIYVNTQGQWSTPPTGLGGDGVGPVAAVLVDGRIFLAACNAEGRISVTWQRTSNAGFGPWSDLGGVVAAGTPAFVIGGEGPPEILVVGVDGRLRTCSFGTGFTFGPWRLLP